MAMVLKMQYNVHNCSSLHSLITRRLCSWWYPLSVTILCDVYVSHLTLNIFYPPFYVVHPRILTLKDNIRPLCHLVSSKIQLIRYQNEFTRDKKKVRLGCLFSLSFPYEDSCVPLSIALTLNSGNCFLPMFLDWE